MSLNYWMMLSFVHCGLVHGGLMGLSRVSLLEANLLDVVQSLVWVNEDAGIARLLLFSLHLGFEALAEMAVLTELVKEVQIATILVVIVENGVLVLEATSTRIIGLTLTPVHVNERERSLGFATFSEKLILHLLVLLLLDLVLRDEPFLKSILLSLRLTDVVGLVIGRLLGIADAILCLRRCRTGRVSLEHLQHLLNLSTIVSQALLQNLVHLAFGRRVARRTGRHGATR